MNAGTYDAEKGSWLMYLPAREWYSVQETSQILGVGGPTVYSAIRRGSLVAYKVGGSTKVKHDDLVNYIARRMSNAVATTTADEAIARIIPSEVSSKKADKMAGAIAADAPPPVGNIQLDIFQDEPTAVEVTEWVGKADGAAKPEV